MAEEQAALWNGAGGDAWVALHEVLDGMLAPLGEVLLDSVDVQPDDHVLDVGCGTGATTVDIAGRLGPRGRSVGIDISATMLAAARTRAEQARRAAQFVVGDAQAYPFEPFAFADPGRVRNTLNQSEGSDVDVRRVDIACGLAEDQLMRYLASMGPVGRVLSQADDQSRGRVFDVLRDAFDPFVHDGEVRYTAACWLVGARRP